MLAAADLKGWESTRFSEFSVPKNFPSSKPPRDPSLSSSRQFLGETQADSGKENFLRYIIYAVMSKSNLNCWKILNGQKA